MQKLLLIMLLPENLLIELNGKKFANFAMLENYSKIFGAKFFIN